MSPWLRFYKNALTPEKVFLSEKVVCIALKRISSGVCCEKAVMNIAWNMFFVWPWLSLVSSFTYDALCKISRRLMSCCFVITVMSRWPLYKSLHPAPLVIVSHFSFRTVIWTLTFADAAAELHYYSCFARMTHFVKLQNSELVLFGAMHNCERKIV